MVDAHEIKLNNQGEMVMKKPVLLDCDETSLKMQIDDGVLSTGSKVTIEYKEPRQPWETAKSVEIASSIVELVDLKPGTAYFVRIVIQGDETEFSEPAVFDTVPVDCGPKKRRGKSCKQS